MNNSQGDGMIGICEVADLMETKTFEVIMDEEALVSELIDPNETENSHFEYDYGDDLLSTIYNYSQKETHNPVEGRISSEFFPSTMGLEIMKGGDDEYRELGLNGIKARTFSTISKIISFYNEGREINFPNDIDTINIYEICARYVNLSFDEVINGNAGRIHTFENIKDFLSEISRIVNYKLNKDYILREEYLNSRVSGFGKLSFYNSSGVVDIGKKCEDALELFKNPEKKEGKENFLEKPNNGFLLQEPVKDPFGETIKIDSRNRF